MNPVHTYKPCYPKDPMRKIKIKIIENTKEQERKNKITINKL
jgi:hypothetical protein